VKKKTEYGTTLELEKILWVMRHRKSPLCCDIRQYGDVFPGFVVTEKENVLTDSAQEIDW